MIPIGKACIGEEERSAVERVFARNIFARGEELLRFEEEFAKYCSSKYAIATNSCTSALIAGLKSCNITGEVITAPNSFIATTNAIILAGAKPVFVDIEPETFNIDIKKIEERITKRTEAILPIHMYGHPCDLQPIMDLAEKHNLKIIADAAHAIGANYENKKIGSVVTSCFSFYPTKPMTVGGEGGMITTNDETVSEKIKSIIDVETKKSFISYNFRMSEIQAAIGVEQLKKLDKFIEKRRDIAKLYRKLLTPEVTAPKEKNGVFHSYCYYVIKAKKRDELKRFLEKKGIETKVHYPPVHLCPHIKSLGFKKGMFPVTEKISEEILSLPIYPDLTESEVEFISNKIREFYGE